MRVKTKTKYFLKVIRAKFLVLSLMVGFAASGLGLQEGVFDLFNASAGIFSLILMHIAVNSLNSASDYRTGIDSCTEKTPFSGGIDTLLKDNLSYRSTLITGLLSIASTVPIFLHFGFRYNFNLVLGIFTLGTIIVIGYTCLFARNYLGEITAGLGLGSLPFFFIFYIQSGTITDTSLMLSASMFIPVFNLLLINEFPDLEADRENGRKNIPILIGKDYSVYLYSLSNLLFTVVIIYMAYYSFLPYHILITTLPAFYCLKNSYDISRQDFNVKIGNMKVNTLAVNSMFFLTGLSLILSVF